MKEKKNSKDTNYNSNNSTKQSTMEIYKLTATHNVFNNNSGHNIQIKEDFMKRQVINSSPKKMPDYQKMSVYELKIAVAKYGIKPLSKAAMVHQLVVIWNYLHQNNYFEDESSLENESENVVRDTENKNILSTNSKASSDNIDHVKEPSGLSDNIKRKIKDHIISKYYEKIIRYEQLEFDDIYKEIVDLGILCTEKQLQYYLDLLNIQNKSLKRTDEWKKDHKKYRKT
ncbi:unnamed protein product [Rhizophagus irregularis]|uniref:Uncharacterized protein n=1 Tax=Rhizophagus irregularis TaxID=588596 RepID=A0A2I1FV97_9GLOM|nr:hypothetical protein RhiirA4_508895 [Rhizophagus irregularis]CAB4436391.1 unnamed protein product [Rhizophagus irregularis]